MGSRMTLEEEDPAKCASLGIVVHSDAGSLRAGDGLSRGEREDLARARITGSDSCELPFLVIYGPWRTQEVVAQFRDKEDAQREVDRLNHVRGDTPQGYPYDR